MPSPSSVLLAGEFAPGIIAVVTPDGVARIAAENLAFPNGIGNKHCVRLREGGQVLQTVDADRGCLACTLGGADGRTLYIVTAQWPNDFRTPTCQVLAVQVRRTGRPRVAEVSQPLARRAVPSQGGFPAAAR